MFLGHLGTAAYFASRDRRVPLWWYLAASLFPDGAFLLLLALGVERTRHIDHIASGMYALRFSFDWSHSLMTIAVVAVVVGLVGGRRFGPRSGVLLAYATLIHWPLDALVHRPELSLLIGNAWGLPRFGLGLWQFGAVSAIVELTMLMIGVLSWWPVHASRHRIRRWAVSAVSLLVGVGILVSFGRIAVLLSA